MTKDRLGRIKGSAISEFIKWYERELGADRLRLVAREMPEDLATLVHADQPALGIEPSKWYPAAGVHFVLDSLLNGKTPIEVERLAVRGGQEVVRRLLRGPLAVVVNMMLTPTRFKIIAASAWRQNYDTGILENMEIGPNEHRVVVRGWSGHHHFICKMNTAAKVAIYEAMGCKDVVIVQRECIDEDSETCGSTIRFKY